MTGTSSNLQNASNYGMLLILTLFEIVAYFKKKISFSGYILDMEDLHL